MGRPESFGNGGVPQELMPDIIPPEAAPISGNVIDTLGNSLGPVGIVATGVSTRSGARRAAVEAVHTEIGQGYVDVAGELIDEIYEAGLAVEAALEQAAASAMANFDADWEASGLRVDFGEAEAGHDEARSLEDEHRDTESDESDKTTDVLDDEVRDGDPEEETVRAAFHLGEVMLLDLVGASEAEADDADDDTVFAEVVDESSRQPEAIGELLLSVMTVEVDLPERADGARAGYDDEYDGNAEDEQTEAPETVRGELQSDTAESTMHMLAALALVSLTEKEGEAQADGEGLLLEPVVLTDENIVLLALASQNVRREHEADAEYVLAA